MSLAVWRLEVSTGVIGGLGEDGLLDGFVYLAVPELLVKVAVNGTHQCCLCAVGPEIRVQSSFSGRGWTGGGSTDCAGIDVG